MKAARAVSTGCFSLTSSSVWRLIEVMPHFRLTNISAADFRQSGKCVILNSRQSKRPSILDRWVVQTERAVEFLTSHDYLLLSSIGMNTWELAVHLGNIRKSRQVLLLPHQSAESDSETAGRIAADFKLDDSRTGFLFFEKDARKKRGEKQSWAERDRLSIDLAHTIIPVSLRRGGSLTTLLQTTVGKEYVNDFITEHCVASDRVNYDLRPGRLNRDIMRSDWNYITHWTRSSHRPYPGESSFEYYEHILTANHYPNSAFDTLKRILRERKIRKSRRFIRGGYEVVSFTALTPPQAVALMRWRKRYVYYSFEPYGVAIDSSIARELGIREVTYGAPELFNGLSPDDQPFYQNPGSLNADWRPEKELRHCGDLDLTVILAEKIKLITYTPAEAAKLEQLFPYECLPLTSRD